MVVVTLEVCKIILLLSSVICALLWQISNWTQLVGDQQMLSAIFGLVLVVVIEQMSVRLRKAEGK